MLISSHVGIEDNEIVDQQAKLETCLEQFKKISGPITKKCVTQSITKMEIKVIIKDYVNYLWENF